MTTLQAGDKAPAIHGKDQHGNDFDLATLKGKKVILYFYPKDDTPGCTKEACDFRDNYQMLTTRGFEVVGVSNDTEKAHQKFIKKYDLPFTLLADTDKSIVNAYGVFGLKKFMGREYEGIHRTTFVIDEQGVIEQVVSKVDTANSSQQILDLLATS